jgi:Na+-driven multidrug efflux pump/anti-sigma regulatory factor (Ser/Thr protein kinase)
MKSEKTLGNEMISRLFFSMLPVQILIFAMGSINSIVDGAIAGRFIDSTAVGIIGLYYSMVSILQAAGYMLLGGTTVLCGRYMGRGDFEKTEGIFSLNMTVTLLLGAMISVISFIMPGNIAVMLGANEELKGELVKYIMGYAVGIIPMLLAQQIASFLQMERKSTLGYIGIAGMVISNTVFNILFVVVLKMGMWGLALATSASNFLYFFVLVPYYFTKGAQFHYRLKNAYWKDLGNMFKIGFPGALLVFCLSMRGMVINRVLLRYAGNDGLSAMSAFNMVSGILIAYCLGNGSIIRMLISVFAGEEDKFSMRRLLKIVLTKGMALAVVFAAFVLVISPFISAIFFPDRASNVYKLNHQLLIIYALCIPLIQLCQVYTNYFQALDHRLFVNVVSVFDGFFSMVIPALILAPLFGAFGVWIANPIGIVLTLLLVPVYAVIYWKHVPRSLDECMFLKPDFGVAEDHVLDIVIHDMDELMLSSAQTQEFCKNSGIGNKTSYYSALCLEEMAGNVITHGFTADKKKHSLNSMIINKGDRIMLRIKDDCIPFNPLEMRELTSGKGSFDNIGIRMIYRIADDISYQNMLGLNVLTVTFNSDNELFNQEESHNE